MRLVGLPPLVSVRTRLLVLGSFPGAASLAARRYYAHPQNQFWRILQAIWADSPHIQVLDSYEKRSKWLLERGFGLWDVYASCERQGSLDTAIRNAQVNDFAALAVACPDLCAVAHNGGESFKHAALVVEGLRAAGSSTAQLVQSYKLPSTSPAHASWSFERKLAAWRDVMVAAGLL